MAIEISVVPDLSGLERKLKGEFAAFLRRASAELVRRLPPRVAQLVGEGLRASPEYASLLDGRLRGEMGLADPQSALDSVVLALQASVRVEALPPRGDVLGGVSVGVFRSDFSDALSASGAEYVSTNKGGKSTVIAWLSWLLFKGDAVVITGHEILWDYPARRVTFRSASRTGLPIMVGRDFTGVRGRYNRRAGRSGPSEWRVPAEFAGTESSNWLTRVAAAVAPKVEAVLRAEAKEVLG